MTRSEWFRRTIDAYWDDPCPICGHPANNFEVLDDGAVSQYCEVCQRARIVGEEQIPSHFDPEPDGGDDLPF